MMPEEWSTNPSDKEEPMEPLEDEEGEHFIGTEELRKALAPRVTVHACGPQCVDGTENHDWSGPVIKFDRGGSSTCAKCGQAAIDISMWY